MLKDLATKLKVHGLELTVAWVRNYFFQGLEILHESSEVSMHLFSAGRGRLCLSKKSFINQVNFNVMVPLNWQWQWKIMC